MKHPTREQWMEWLYDEVSADEKAQLAAHLESCADCRAIVENWRATTRTLDQYVLPAHVQPARTRFPAKKWAAAAAVLLLAGFGLGQMFAKPHIDATMRASLKAELRGELLGEMKQQQQLVMADFAKAAAETRDADNKAIFAAIARVDADRITANTAMRKDLETMAVLTEDSFRKAQQQLVTLANYEQSGINSPNQ